LGQEHRLKERPKPTREDAVNATDIANDLHNDFVSSGAMWRSLMKAREAGIVQFDQHRVERVVMLHMVVACCKVDDLLAHPPYAMLLGDFERDWRRDVRRHIAAVQLRDLRNGYMGHIHYGDLNRPMYASELDALLKKVTGGKMDTFVDWACGDQSPMMLMLAIRNFLAEKHTIKSGEIVNR